MTYAIEVTGDDEWLADEQFETSEELGEWLADIIAESFDTGEFEVTIVHDLQTGDSG